MTNATCTVNSSSTTNGVNVSPSGSVTIQLADLTGVNSWSIICTNTDDLQVAATITASLSINTITKTATFTAPSEATGCALQFTSVVNSGMDVNGVVQPSYTSTFGIFAIGTSGLRLFFSQMTVEGNAIYGWIDQLNALHRLGNTTPNATGSVSGSIVLTHDLGGTYNAPSVVGLQGHQIASTAPTDGYVLTWSSADSKWEPKAATAASGSVSAIANTLLLRDSSANGYLNELFVHFVDTNAVTNLVLAPANATSIDMGTATLEWQAAVSSPILKQIVSASGAGQNMTIQPQAGHSNGTDLGGNLILSLNAPVSNASPKLQVAVGSSPLSILDIYQSGSATTTVESKLASWRLLNAVNSGNILIEATGTSSTMSLSSIGSMNFTVNSVTGLQLNQASIQPFVNITFDKSQSNPIISQANNETLNYVGNNLTVAAQSVFSGVGSGGDLILTSGGNAPPGSNSLSGEIQLQIAEENYLVIRNNSGSKEIDFEVGNVIFTSSVSPYIQQVANSVGAGNNFTIETQPGHVAGSNLSGNLQFSLGVLVSGVSPLFRFMTGAHGALSSFLDGYQSATGVTTLISNNDIFNLNVEGIDVLHLHTTKIVPHVQLFTFDNAIGIPTITQTTSTVGTGNNFIIAPQWGLLAGTNQAGNLIFSLGPTVAGGSSKVQVATGSSLSAPTSILDIYANAANQVEIQSQVATMNIINSIASSSIIISSAGTSGQLSLDSVAQTNLLVAGSTVLQLQTGVLTVVGDLAWDTSDATPSIYQNTVVSSSAGNPFLIRSQNVTGNGAGGDLILQSGASSGAGGPGLVTLKSGATTMLILAGSNSSIEPQVSNITFNAGLTPIININQHASSTGNTFSIEGQQGHSGSVGGVVNIRGGAGGTGGTNLAGAIQLSLGQTVSSASALLSVMTGAAVGSSILDISQTAASTTTITSNLATLSIGNSVASSIITITSAGTSGIINLDATTTGNLTIGGTASLTWNSTTLTPNVSAVTFAAGTTPVISVTQNASGTGATFSIEGQQGKAGSVGGVVNIRGGAGGTGGTNLAGAVQISLGQTVSNASALFSLMSGSGVGTSFMDFVQNSATSCNIASNLAIMSITNAVASSAITINSSGTSGQLNLAATTTLSLKNGSTVRMTIDGTGIGFYATAGVAQQTRATNAPLTAATGSASGTINDVTSAFSQTILNNNFKSIVTTLNALELIVHNLGLST